MRLHALLVFGVLLGSSSCTGASSTAATPAGPPRFVEVDAGDFHTCARTDSGTVECWGQCGLQCGARPDGVGSRLPVAGLVDVAEIAVGDVHGCARLADGDVTCWGNNYSGGLGRIEPGLSPAPLRVPDVHDVVEIATGGDLTCARHGDGGVTCWGTVAGDYDRSAAAAALRLPRRVDGVAKATAITVSGSNACAREGDGAWACWAWNSREGDGLREMGSARAGARGADVLAWTDGTCHCDLRRDGVVRCEGTGILSAQLADGTSPPVQLHRCPADGLAGVRTLAPSCAIAEDGGVKCWGAMFFARGSGPAIYDDLQAPTPVPGITAASQLAVGSGHVCVLGESGALDCWGTNTQGQVDGTPSEAGVWPPRRIEAPARP